ncbi:MAG: hypothetical protein HUT38_04000 [Candidatus Paceibacter sp.]|nr:hypothetical protein [Candidatus Paceibacter sp.]
MAKKFVVLATGMLLCFLLDVVALASETIDGTVETFFSENKESPYDCKPSYFLRDANGKKIRLLLKGLDRPPGLPPNTRVTAIGDYADNGFRCEKIVPQTPQLIGKKEVDFSDTTGEQPTVVLLVKFKDLDDSQIGEGTEGGVATKADAENVYFNPDEPWSLDNFYRENSRDFSGDKIWFTGKCHDEWRFMPQNSDYYGYSEGGQNRADIQIDLILRDALEVYKDVYFPDYTRLVIVMGGMWSYAISTVGKTEVATDDGAINMSVNWLDYRDIKNKRLNYKYHEMGHALGAYHANGMWFKNCLDIDRIPNWSGSNNGNDEYEISVYNDDCIMGHGTLHFQEPLKERFGWRSAEQIIEATSDQTITLDQRALPSDGLKYIKIPCGFRVDEFNLIQVLFYEIEYGYPTGVFESNKSALGPEGYVFLRILAENQLWGRTDSDTIVLYDRDDYGTYNLYHVLEARDFCDSVGTNISLIGKSGADADAQATVKIWFECAGEQAPFLFNYWEQYNYSLFGGSVDPFITVGNQEGVACGRNKYKLEAFPEGGWEVYFSKDLLELDPFTSENVSVHFQPPAYIEKQNYEIRLRVKDTTNGLYTDSVVHIYVDGWTPKPTPTPSPSPKPSPTPPKPTPTPSPTLSPTPSPTPTPMTVKEIQLSPEKIKVRVEQEADEVIGETITAMVTKGKRKIYVSPASATSDQNGQAVFKIKGLKKGKAQVVFSSQEVNKKANVKVKP